ncbi:MAG: hypothetical protein NVSMB42_18870 [Herpetosiphon sp.]
MHFNVSHEEMIRRPRAAEGAKREEKRKQVRMKQVTMTAAAYNGGWQERLIDAVKRGLPGTPRCGATAAR